MICPLCGYLQPDSAVECLQCHSPLKAAPTGRKPPVDLGHEGTEDLGRTERRRRPRSRERTMMRRGEKSVAPPAASLRVEPPRPKEAVVVRVDPPQVDVPPAAEADSLPLPAGSPLTQILERLKRVMVTTTSEFQHRTISEYRGVVTAGAMVKLEGWAAYLEELKDVGALRYAPFYDYMRKARDIVMTDLKIEAAKLGANGVVGVTVQFDPSQADSHGNRLVWMVAIGTAVVLSD